MGGVRALLQEGKLSCGHARALAANPVALSGRFVAKGLSVGQTHL
jgi:hypothetical protein